ncbi:tdp2, partial [Symbiodinium sp. CCMP2456]
AALVSYDFGLKRRVVEIDRDAYRRWMYASMRARVEEAEGKEPSDSAPFEDLYKFSKETAETVHKFIAEANSASSAPAGLKKDIEKVLKENPPSDDFKVRFPRVLHERLAKKMGRMLQTFVVVHVCCEADIVKEIFKVMPKYSDTPMPPLDEEIEDYAANHSEAETKEFKTRTAPEELLKTAAEVIKPYYVAREANEKKVQDLKAFFRSQKDVAGKTK